MYFYYNLRSKVAQILGRVTLCLRHLNAVDNPDNLHCVNGRKSLLVATNKQTFIQIVNGLKQAKSAPITMNRAVITSMHSQSSIL